MRVALHHLERFVPQHLGDFQLACAVHGQVAGRTVAQVVEAEINDSGFVPGLLPGLTDIDRRAAIFPGEKEIWTLPVSP